MKQGLKVSYLTTCKMSPYAFPLFPTQPAHALFTISGHLGVLCRFDLGCLFISQSVSGAFDILQVNESTIPFNYQEKTCIILRLDLVVE
jgi:hypothetical protein